MTKIYAPGDTGQAICPHCEKRVTTSYAYRDVPFDDGSGVVKDILAAVCDTCDRVAAIPAQSTPAIRRARDIADIPLEVSLLAPEIEVLDAAAFSIAPQSTKIVGADVHQVEVPDIDVVAIKARTGLPISAPVVPQRAGRSQA